MKLFFLLIFVLLFINSCEIYMNNRDIKIGGLTDGYVVISSSNFYNEFIIEDVNELDFNFPKGEIIFVTYYPLINNRFSRYPLGAVIDLKKEYVTLSPHLGLLTKNCNNLNKLQVEFYKKNLYELVDLFLESDNPWIYSPYDINLFLLDKIRSSSITKYHKLDIPELNYLYGWDSENPLFYYWYPSIQFFYNKSSDIIYRVEIKEDGSYSGFEEVN